MRYDIVIFDIDGTLVKVPPRRHKFRAIRRFLQKEGIQVRIDISSAYREASRLFDLAAPVIKDEGTLWDLFTETTICLLGQFDIQDPSLKDKIKELACDIKGRGSHVIYKDAMQICKFLASRNVSLFAVTSSNSSDGKLKGTNLEKYFEKILSARSGLTKGEQILRIIREHQKKLILHVGNDLISDVFLPRALGCQAILLDRSGKCFFGVPTIRTLTQMKRLWTNV
jgi:FMN phosphatase YigB (HAD superfamily)